MIFPYRIGSRKKKTSDDISVVSADI